MGAVGDVSTSSKRRPSSGKFKKKSENFSQSSQNCVESKVNGEAEKIFCPQNLLKYANFPILMQKIL